jgi:hypothetical protein
MADVPNNRFVMHGARAAIAGGMVHIQEQVHSIERAVSENPGLAFDLAKTLIESVCRTVLDERGIPCNPNDDLPALFKAVRKTLPFLPVSVSGETKIRRSIEQTLGGLHMAVAGVCELRNQCGFASHGASAQRPAMESVQALLAAESADAIVGFLNRVHRQDFRPIESNKIAYDNNADFNDYVDNAHDIVRIFDVEFRPSEVLYQMEPESYRVYFAEYNAEDQETGDETGTEGKLEGVG